MSRRSIATFPLRDHRATSAAPPTNLIFVLLPPDSDDVGPQHHGRTRLGARAAIVVSLIGRDFTVWVNPETGSTCRLEATGDYEVSS